MFDFYKDYKIQYMDNDIIYIVDLKLYCSSLYYAKEAIDMDIKKKVKCCEVTSCVNNIELAPLPKAVPQFFAGTRVNWEHQQEGTTPMRYNDNTAYANASIQSAQSDTSIQRDYLLKRLASADYPKDRELRNLYNLHTNNTPKNYKDMIAIIQAGTYTIDPKIEKAFEAAEAISDDEDVAYGPIYGIIWPGPVADYPGFQTAAAEKTKQYTAAKDIIMVSDAAAGLAAIQAFEAWLPAVTPAPATPAS